MWNKRYLWFLIPIIVVLVGSGYFYYTTATASADETEDPSIQTAVVRQGDLTIFASGAGQVIPATEIGLGFDENGTLSEILVQVGDEVQEGQVLARLQTQETPESIAASVAEAELNVVKAQQSLDDIYDNAEMETASALKAVEEAQQAMEDLLSSNLEQAAAWQAVIEAEDAVEDAQLDIYISQSTAGQADIDAAYAQMLLAAEALEKAAENFAPYANKPEDSLTRANAQANLSAAQQDYDEAVRNYNALTSTMDETATKRLRRSPTQKWTPPRHNCPTHSANGKA
jgi:multidrug efflux pump subunit AcrA (membrane-fusion protein)